MSKIDLHIRDMVILTLLVLAMALPGLSSLPVIDRDEARYAQASVQMLESGDYINIRFQDQARNKKPAGAYWAQALSVKAFSDVEKRQIWAHRIPSVLGALLAVLATYWGGRRLLGREAALYGSAMLAVSFIFVFEAHIAKTDALLLGFATLTLAALASLRNGGDRKTAIKAALLFWFGLGMAVMIKGPILPFLLGLCFLGLLVWERKAKWLKPLIYWPGPVLFLVIVLPWAVLIWRATDGAFFTDAIGNDLAPKLQGVQESHPGPPGYYAATIWLAFWPACLFLLPGLVFAMRSVTNKAGFDSPVAKAVRFLLCWAVPFFIVLEFIPTKLPHYTLLTFPALALLSGAALATLVKVNEFVISRRIGAVFFSVLTIGLVAALLMAEAYFGNFPGWSFLVLYLGIILGLFASWSLWHGRAIYAFAGAVTTAAMLNFFTYQFTLPSLKPLQISARIKQALADNNIQTPLSDITLISTQFTEPSLVYRLGTGILLGKPDERLDVKLKPGDIVLLDRHRQDTEEYQQKLVEKLAITDLCLTSLQTIKGFNYAKGDAVKLDILRADTCPQAISEFSTLPPPTLPPPTLLLSASPKDGEPTTTRPDP